MDDLSHLSDADLEAIANGGEHSSAPDLSHLSDEELQRIANQDGKTLSSSADDSTASALAKGAGTVGIQGLADAGAGLIGNTRATRDYLLARGLQAVGGPEAKDSLASVDTWRKTHPWLAAALDPTSLFPTGDEVAAPILEKTGQYTPDPDNGWGQAAMAAGRTGVGMLGPGALGGLNKARGLIEAGESVPKILGEVGKTAVRQVPGGAVAGGLGEIATEAAHGDPLAGMAVGAVVPGVAGAAASRLGNAVDRFAAPMRAGRQQGLADEMLRVQATDPQKALADLHFQPEEIVPGSKPTTGELTGDLGLLQEQNRLRTESPEFDAAIKNQEGGQNVARRAAINEMADPDANQMAPSRMVEKHLADLDASTEARIKQIQDAADQANAAVPPKLAPEAIGARTRAAIEDVRAQRTKAENDLYDLVPKDVQIVAAPVQKAAVKVLQEIDPYAEKPVGRESTLLEDMARLPDTVQFSSLRAIDRRLSAFMQETRETPGMGESYRRAVQLKGAVKDAMSNAVDNQAAYEAQAVKAGRMAPEDTIIAKWQQAADDVNARQQEASGRATASLGGGRAVNAPSDYSATPRQGQGGGRLSDAANPQGLRGSGPEQTEMTGGLSAVEDLARQLGAKFDASENNGVIRLSRIVIPAAERGAGKGSQIMDALADYADQTGQRIALTPSGDFGGSVPRLNRFYKQFDFAPNKGRARDLSVSEAMIRKPKSIEPVPESASVPPETPARAFDQADAEALKAANAAHSENQQIYKQGPVEAALATYGFKGQYRAPDSALASAAFRSGDRGADTANAFMRAADNSPEVVSSIQDAAVNGLRAKMKGSERLTQSALDAWKRDHEPALRAIDAVSPGFSKQFDTAAGATEVLAKAESAKANIMKAAQNNAASKFMGLTDPSEVRSTIGSMFSAKTGPTQVKEVVSRVGSDPQALEGLKRAGVEHLTDKFSNAGVSGGEKILSGAKLGNFLDQHGNAMEALYGRDGMANARRVAADLERTQAAHDAVKQAGSPTARNAKSYLTKAIEKAGHGSIGGMVAIAGWEAFQHGGIEAALGVAAAAALKSFISKLRAAGIHKVNDLYAEGLRDPEVGRAMLARAMKNGKVDEQALSRLATAISRSVEIGSQESKSASQQPSH